jgi:N-acetylglutamate synthase-like GNAT family acetyltransferase
MPASDMAETIAIFHDAAASLSEVQTFYASVGYFQVVTADCIVISARSRDTIVGVVRLSPENGVQVLRGMRIAPSYQRRGIGARMLWEISKFVRSQECFCLPHAWLEGFYGIIGFARIEDDDAPPHLRKRLAESRRRHPQLIVMRRSAKCRDETG